MVHSDSLKKVNAYKVDIQGKYHVSVIFIISYLSLFDVGNDSRSNHFEEKRDDATLYMISNDVLRVFD